MARWPVVLQSHRWPGGHIGEQQSPRRVQPVIIGANVLNQPVPATPERRIRWSHVRIKHRTVDHISLQSPRHRSGLDRSSVSDAIERGVYKPRHGVDKHQISLPQHRFQRRRCGMQNRVAAASHHFVDELI